MSDGISILDEIKRGGYESSLITTFNAYLPFYEEVVLRHLINQGVRHNILMMDARQASYSIKSHPPHLAGRYYTLIPMKAVKAFHPKVIFLAGKNKGALLVGSHNLTLSGFGYNRELTNLIKVTSFDDKEAIAVLQSAWQQSIQWVNSQNEDLPQHVLEMVTKIADFAPWLRVITNISPEKSILITSQAGTISLWTQLKNYIKGDVRRVIVTGAFFDSEFEFIRIVNDELNPQEFVVGVDPETVQMPIGITPHSVKFTNCKNLGAVGGDARAGYFHAKAIVLETTEGNTILVTGSANPSSPAWLSDGLSENVEAIFLRVGDEAASTARELGLLDIPAMSELSKQDWHSVSNNWQSRTQSEDSSTASIRIALALDKGIIFSANGQDKPSMVSCDILGPETVLLLSCNASLADGKYFAEVPDEIKDAACFIRFEIAGVQNTCIVQHQKLIEENSRTSTQRRFREALASLNTDSPDLETLIRCVDKIIFDKAGEVNKFAERIKPTKAPEGGQKQLIPKPGDALSIDVSDTKKTRKKFRLRQSDDLAYLLDILIYHLRQDAEVVIDKNLEARDAKGRSEEEQVGAEDAEGPGESGLNEDEIAAKTLGLCHAKVRTLVSRMVGHLDKLSLGKNDLSYIIIRLTAVLAVIRQLRNCDGKVSWIKMGQTSVPGEQRVKLLSGIVRNLFEAPNSIIYPAEDLNDADELARLKGLILWLAWDSGIRISKKKPFLESSEEREERVRNNALMIALAQLIQGDEVVEEEAKQSIAPLCSSDMDWLNWILLTDKRLKKIMSNAEKLESAANHFGVLAINPGRPELGVRMILRQDANKTTLAYFGAGKDHIAYLSEALKTASFDISNS